MTDRAPFDLDACVERMTTGPCFICELVRGNPQFAHHIIHEDDEAIIFLSKYPILRGPCLVCPSAHPEDLADLSGTEKVARQHIAEALSYRLNFAVS